MEKKTLLLGIWRVPDIRGPFLLNEDCSVLGFVWGTTMFGNFQLAIRLTSEGMHQNMESTVKGLELLGSIPPIPAIHQEDC